MIDIEVIDNFLDQSYIDLIEDWILRHGKWSYRPNISGDPWGKIENPWFHGLGIKIHDPTCDSRDTFDSTGFTFMIPAILKIQETFGLRLNLMDSCIRARFDMRSIYLRSSPLSKSAFATIGHANWTAHQW